MSGYPAISDGARVRKYIHTTIQVRGKIERERPKKIGVFFFLLV